MSLEQAPADHAEAILAGYEILQGAFTTEASSNCCEASLAEAIVFLKLWSRQRRCWTA